ncbi:TetR/AcrR family transcriptional regulator [Nocardia sp. NPDC049220]|uniref:TetR/AcrR family transcriptional regulator n=1 Tax=Nocardia sp. NPDC049220 TaxID=3155273 RepID=UPI00340D027A
MTAKLVNRYFGSKERLFAEAADVSMTPRTVIPEHPDHLTRRIAAGLVERTAPGATELDPFLLVLRSTTDPRAAEILAAGIRRHPARALSDLLEGPATDERAMLAHALIAGIYLMRTVLGVDELVDADPAELTQRIERMLTAALAEPDPKKSNDTKTITP